MYNTIHAICKYDINTKITNASSFTYILRKYSSNIVTFYFFFFQYQNKEIRETLDILCPVDA